MVPDWKTPKLWVHSLRANSRGSWDHSRGRKGSYYNQAGSAPLSELSLVFIPAARCDEQGGPSSHFSPSICYCHWLKFCHQEVILWVLGLFANHGALDMVVWLCGNTWKELGELCLFRGRGWYRIRKKERSSEREGPGATCLIYNSARTIAYKVVWAHWDCEWMREQEWWCAFKAKLERTELFRAMISWSH